MFKKMSALSCLVLFAFLVSGCNGGKGDDFIGRWEGQNTQRMYKPTYVMTISKDGENFHIDLARTLEASGNEKPNTSVQKFEAKAESDTVLSMLGGLATMRLEGGVLHFDGTEFLKSK
ncbi:hypothetical protein NLO74_23440 [Pseudomonas tremae]|uniref:hypothetical protein n=1 Tax=Pseudomonas syringae group TaxID=136849 RepID=UPI0006D5E780|nr:MULTISPECIES: hypothetical protein [Pseudomonas syringae group]MCF5715556.1 hypothetical protein [Pseudomonas tremae]MCF5747325.1 hypothetical protein [Pseudomonas tremae]MCQ3028944.1 hypothetical protein [Pseudomonas tremae]UQB31739.1 hypothetical protein I9H06_26495 [Pseudomonas tremae]UQB39501.1 hypothetical protein I9H09_26245 [Pseudomonas tremae]